VGVTVVSAADRQLASAAAASRPIGSEHLLLASTSLLAMVALLLAASGRLQRSNSLALSAPSVINLNSSIDAQALEPALASIYTQEADRRLAAKALAAFIATARESGDLDHVAEILNARVTEATIERTAGLVEFRAALQRARQDGRDRNPSAAMSVPVLTSADLAGIKRWVIVRTREAFARQAATWAVLYVLAFWCLATLWWYRGVRADAVLVAAAHLLTAIGFAVLLTRPDPLRDTLLFVRFAETVIVALVVLGGVSLLDFRKAAFLSFSYIPLLGALVLSVALIAFGSGPGSSRAKVNLGPVQPIEVIRLLLALFLAGYFARRWELLRQVHTHAIGRYAMPSWLRIPRVEYVLPLIAGIGAALLLFFLQRDLGPALLLACVFLSMYAVARNRVILAVTGLAILIAGFYLGYALDISSTLSGRVAMWMSPWDNAIRGGDQVAQAAWALSTGRISGTGLGFGDARYLPAGHTDLALAAVGEELGFIGLTAVAAVYALIAARGFRIALRSSTDYGFFLATAVTLFLVIPVLVMGAGILGLLPLTGVVTPFLSYGGSAMVANFAALGILTAIRAHASATVVTRPFVMPMRALGATLAVFAVVVLGVLFNTQVVSADDTVIRPHLGLQGDGVRRYQYNQRVLDLVATLPRGTVFDRAGFPLATSDPSIVTRAQTRAAALGLTPDASCKSLGARCYPLGDTAVHLLGDVRTHTNWSASNTSYVERDFETRLRGFDDHAAVVRTDGENGPVPVVKRDFSELVPMLRHRHQPEHDEVKAVIDRARDLTLTIDARLQSRVAAIVARHAARSVRRHAAAVVLDPDTGDVLAVASYPFPSLNAAGADLDPAAAADAWLDRARFGLYPPGSTFKLVTAAAALRRDRDAATTSFVCRLLPDGRIGARIPGQHTVRDDVLDTHPHGAIDMHGGLVHSCNAYFAQLAVRVGPEALLDTAARLGIAVTPSQSVSRTRDTLAQAGYGQGDVVATPLRMARVAAAIASKGIAREPRIDAAAPRAPGDAILPPASAALLARYLRDAVVTGTGRSLRGHRVAIAGKTGTAEVAGQRSHSWFVGFAPFGDAPRKIAFAVLIENAGYGGLAAAPAAGEIVSAAAELGLLH
jgi:cell division protein FtsW (lipid II flippase)